MENNTNLKEMTECNSDNSIDMVEYAKDLYHNVGLNWKQIEHALKEMGIRDASNIIRKLKEEQDETEATEQMEYERQKEEEEVFGTSKSKSPMQRADNKIIIGLLLVTIGLILYLIGIFGNDLKLFIRYGSIGICFGGAYIMVGCRHRSLITKRNNSIDKNDQFQSPKSY